MPPNRKRHKEKEMRVQKGHKIANLYGLKDIEKAKAKRRWPF